jgi:hypothetical protein
MKSFIFFTQEGYTQDLNHTDVNNMQILGDGTGNNVVEAFTSFKRNQTYLSEFAFKEVIALEYVGDFIRQLEL